MHIKLGTSRLKPLLYIWLNQNQPQLLTAEIKAARTLLDDEVKLFSSFPRTIEAMRANFKHCIESVPFGQGLLSFEAYSYYNHLPL